MATKLKTVVLDLETIPNPALIPLLPEPEAAKNLKDPAKIQVDIEEKRIKQVEEMALNPHTNLICCCSMLDIDSGETKSIILPEGPNYSGERELLLQIWDALHCFDRFVTFNGISFDVPVLRFHSMLHHVQPSVNIDCQKYKIGNHIDVRAILGNYETFAKGNLDWYCRIVLGAEHKKPDGINGATVQHLWDCGCYDEIREYCENDVRILAQLYDRMKGYYI